MLRMVFADSVMELLPGQTERNQPPGTPHLRQNRLDPQLLTLNLLLFQTLRVTNGD